MSNSDRSGQVSRRRILQGLAASSSIGLAGCNSLNGDGGDGDQTNGQELGERVPQPLTLEYYSNLGGITNTMENAIPHLRQNFGELVNVEAVPVETAQQHSNKFEDTRSLDLNFGLYGTDPSRLDPHEMIIRNSGHYAGANGRPNGTNYANCHYTNAAVQQARAPNEEKRQELVTEAIKTFSEDTAMMAIAQNPYLSATRDDSLNAQRIGSAGFTPYNPYAYIHSTPASGDRWSVKIEPSATQTNVPYHAVSSNVSTLLSHTVFSSLTVYDHNYELQNELADTIETGDGTEIVVELKDAEFHNGDPVTAEDVQFSYELMWENPGAFPQASAPDYESIDIVDDKTVAFNFAEPYIPLVTKVWPRWGIAHKESWVEAGAEDNAAEFQLPDDNIIGSGPFQITRFSRGQSIRTEPFDGHPMFSPDHGITFEVFSESNAEFRAFQNDDIQVMPAISGEIAERVSEEIPDNASVHSTDGFTSYYVNGQWPTAPTKFTEFNRALSATVNRQQINESAFAGRSEPEMGSSYFTSAHPWYPEGEVYQATDDPTGDVEGAKQILRDAGWGWDGDGNLRYPADADLSPRWPEGEYPNEDNGFPCVTADGEYNQTENLLEE